MTMDPLSNTLLARLDARATELVALRRCIHACPELAFEEHETARLIRARASAAGLRLLDVPGVPTAVVAVLDSGRRGPTVAWRADMDALPIQEPASGECASRVPGVMHACGHDGHVAIALMLAEMLAASAADLAGRYVFLFQPAEEVFRGARALLDAGVLDALEVDEIYGLHLTTHLPSGQVAIGEGAMWAAADSIRIELEGRAAHGAYPHKGLNPIIAAAQAVGALQGLVPALEAAVLSICEFHAGNRPNIIPERAVLRGSLRTLLEPHREGLLHRIREVAAGVALANGAVAHVELEPVCAAVVNTPRCAAAVRSAAARVLPPSSIHVSAPSLASDDMSAFLSQRPGCYFRAGVGPSSGTPTAHHSPGFHLDESGLLPAARVALATLLGSGRMHPRSLAEPSRALA